MNMKQKEKGRGRGWPCDNEVNKNCIFFSLSGRGGNGRCARGSNLSLEGILGPTSVYSDRSRFLLLRTCIVMHNACQDRKKTERGIALWF